MKKTFEFTEQEAELLRKEQYKYLINDNIDHFLLLVQQIISERITPEPGESGQSAEDVLDQHYKGYLKRIAFPEQVLAAMTTYASQVCADKDREISLLKKELDRAKEEIEKSHMDKIYSIHDLKSELSAANESLTVMLRKNAELLELVRHEVVVPSEKERREIFDNLSDSNFCEQPDELSLFLVVYWDVIGKIESLNQTLTFTELNHEK